jgi:hypothetical protein
MLHGCAGLMYGGLTNSYYALPIGVTLHQFYEWLETRQESAKHSAIDALWFVLGHGISKRLK